MIDIPTEELLVKRYSGQWDRGHYVTNPAEQFKIIASVQPLKPNEVLLLPEHRRTDESVKLYCETKLRTSDEKNNLPADRIYHDGKEYEVHSVANWSIGTDIPHFKIVAVKLNDQGGGNES